MAWNGFTQIRDVSVPNAAFDTKWPESSAHLREILSGGGVFLVHCRGGIGRACTVAARLMVELGEDPEAAVALWRRRRYPNAVETKGQERWVASGRDTRSAPAPKGGAR